MQYRRVLRLFPLYFNSLNQLDPCLEHLEGRRHVLVAAGALDPVERVEAEFALALLPGALYHSRPLAPSWRGRVVGGLTDPVLLAYEE